MKKFQIYILTLLYFIITNLDCFSQSYNCMWAKMGTGINQEDFITCVKNDNSDNSYAIGYFNSDTITFGNYTFVNSNNNNSADMFLIKYDANGNILWANSYGGLGNDEPSSIAIDNNGDIIIVGYYTSVNINFGSNALNSFGGADIFIAKFNSSGNNLWAKGIGGINTDRAHSVAIDNTNNILISGVFISPQIIFDIDTLTNAGLQDIFVAKLDVSGNIIWAKSYGSNQSDNSHSIVVNSSNVIYITGFYCSNYLEIGLDTLVNKNTNNSGDLFIAAFDANGSELWAKSIGGEGNDIAESIALDVSSNVCITGYFSSVMIDFGNSSIFNTNTGFDVYLAKFDQNGNNIWANSFGSSGTEFSYSIDTDLNGDIYATGYSDSPIITFGVNSLINQGANDLFIIKVDSSGLNKWAKLFGVNGNDNSMSISVGVNHEVLIGGFFNSNYLTFSPYVLNNPLPSLHEPFIARFNVITGVEEQNTSNSELIFPNPSSGSFTIEFQNIEQCEGILQIINNMGQSIYNVNFSTTNGMISQKIDLGDRFKSGFYIVRLSINGELYNSKVMLKL